MKLHDIQYTLHNEREFHAHWVKCTQRFYNWFTLKPLCLTERFAGYLGDQLPDIENKWLLSINE